MTAAVIEMHTEDDERFWSATPQLRHIEIYARARRVAPWSMLGSVLARLCATIPPNVQLPPLVGSSGSLNLFVGVVGMSGMGKGAGERAARDGVRMGDVFTSSIGSGEGLLHLFTHYDKDEERSVMDRDRVLLSVPEVDALTALGGRQGATLLPTLRSAFTGEQLSPAYANREKALRLDDHSYRLAIIMGIQPGRAGALLGDSDGGTPQRFLWLPSTDPAAPDVPPVAPDPLNIADQLWTDRHVEIPVPANARHRILTERAEVLRGERESSHLLFVRLKVAALMAVLSGRRVIDREDWTLAGRVIRVSERTRRDVADYLLRSASETSRERGRLDGERRAAGDESADEAALRRVCQWVMTKLEKHRDGMTPGALRKVAASRDREVIDAALAALAEVGNVVCNGDSDRGVYRLGGRNE